MVYFLELQRNLKIQMRLKNVKMTETKSTNFIIRMYEYADVESVIHVWEECSSLRSWNSQKSDIQHKALLKKTCFLSVNS